LALFSVIALAKSVALARCDPFPPVDGFAVGGHPIEEVGDDLDVCSTAIGPAELPQLAGGLVIVVDRLVDGVGVDLAGAVTVDRSRNVLDELGQLRLVIGGYAFARCPAFGLRPHSGTIPPPLAEPFPGKWPIRVSVVWSL